MFLVQNAITGCRILKSSRDCLAHIQSRISQDDQRDCDRITIVIVNDAKEAEDPGEDSEEDKFIPFVSPTLSHALRVVTMDIMMI